MTKIDELRQDKADIAAEIAAHEAAAATADGDTLAAHGGAITGLEAKARAIGARLAEALGIQAAQERARAAAAVEAERQAVMARAVALEASWQEFLTAVETLDAAAGALWANHRGMVQEYNAVNREVERLGMHMLGADVLGMLGSATLTNAKNRQGNLCFHA